MTRLIFSLAYRRESTTRLPAWVADEIEKELMLEKNLIDDSTLSITSCEVTETCFDLAKLIGELLEWEQVYNAIRPHQALDCLTPLKLLEHYKHYRREAVMCH